MFIIVLFVAIIFLSTYGNAINTFDGFHKLYILFFLVILNFISEIPFVKRKDSKPRWYEKILQRDLSVLNKILFYFTPFKIEELRVNLVIKLIFSTVFFFVFVTQSFKYQTYDVIKGKSFSGTWLNIVRKDGSKDKDIEFYSYCTITMSGTKVSFNGKNYKPNGEFINQFNSKNAFRNEDKIIYEYEWNKGDNYYTGFGKVNIEENGKLSNVFLNSRDTVEYRAIGYYLDEEENKLFLKNNDSIYNSKRLKFFENETYKGG